MSTQKGVVVVEVIVVDMAITALEIGGTIDEDHMADTEGTDTTAEEDIIEESREDVYRTLLWLWISWK